MILVLPNQRRLDDLGKVLSGYGAAEMKEAIRTRSGPAYEALTQRGMIVKANHENRLEIAKLNLEIYRLNDELRGKAFDVLRFGALFGPLQLPDAGPEATGRIARYLRRCGIPCTARGTDISPGADAEPEVRMLVGNKVVWVSQALRARLEENMQRTQQVSMKVQLRNAERQVLSFDDAQEKDFAALQQEYLNLLKEQDELLREFYGEGGAAPVSGQQ